MNPAYIVVQDVSSNLGYSDITNNVNRYIEQGYIPVGGITTTVVDNYVDSSSHRGLLTLKPDRFHFTQAMYLPQGTDLNKLIKES